jgi:hypothetical protein
VQGQAELSQIVNIPVFLLLFFSFFVYFCFFFLFCGTGFWTQGPKYSTIWATPPALFAFSYFSDRVYTFTLLTSLRPWSFCLYLLCSGITGVSHHARPRDHPFSSHATICLWWKSLQLCVCGTGVWTQGLHLEPLHQPFFVKGVFKIGSRELFDLPRLASSGDPPDLWLLSS